MVVYVTLQQMVEMYQLLDILKKSMLPVGFLTKSNEKHPYKTVPTVHEKVKRHDWTIAYRAKCGVAITLPFQVP